MTARRTQAEKAAAFAALHVTVRGVHHPQPVGRRNGRPARPAGIRSPGHHERRVRLLPRQAGRCSRTRPDAPPRRRHRRGHRPACQRGPGEWLRRLCRGGGRDDPARGGYGPGWRIDRGCLRPRRRRGVRAVPGGGPGPCGRGGCARAAGAVHAHGARGELPGRTAEISGTRSAACRPIRTPAPTFSTRRGSRAPTR